MNRQQAKILAPIICAYAAGSRIEWQDFCNNWHVHIPTEVSLEALLDAGYKLRIAPKPPKVKEAKLALVLGGECTAIVTKGKWELMEKSPDFLKWISEPFKLLPSDKRTHA